MADLISQIKGLDNVTYDLQDKVSTFGNENLLLKTKTEKSQVYNSTALMSWAFSFSGSLPVGTYTISFDMKSSNGTDKFYYSIANNTSTVTRIGDNVVPTTSYTRFSKTFNYTATATTNCFFITSCASHGVPANQGNSGTVYIKNVKLEKGNKPTDWSPSCYDLATYSNETIEFFQ